MTSSGSETSHSANSRRRISPKSEPIALPTQETLEGVRANATRIANIDELETESSTRGGSSSSGRASDDTVGRVGKLVDEKEMGVPKYTRQFVKKH